MIPLLESTICSDVMARKRKKGNRKKKKPEILTDRKGPFYFRTVFMNGKQVREKVRGFVVVDSKPVDRDEFLRANATEMDLMALGEYELLHELECERNQEWEATDEPAGKSKPKQKPIADDDSDLPF